MSWFGAKSILHGIDPYPLVGKGKAFDYRWPLTYPPPSFIVLAPLGLLSERAAATLFVGLSTFVLALAVTRTSLSLIPLFFAEPFLNAARLGQWNILLTAGLVYPAILIVGAVKPQTIFPIFAANKSRRAPAIAVAGAVALLGLSFLLIPQWPAEWMASVKQMPSTAPMVMYRGGFLILIVLFKWRRPETWLIATLAIVPQTPAWYSTIPLFTVPHTFAEAVILAGTTTAGGWIGAALIDRPKSLDELNGFIAVVQMLSIYLPAIVMVLRRPNHGPSPWWLPDSGRKKEKAA
jgi:hypothetical protein